MLKLVCFIVFILFWKVSTHTKAGSKGFIDSPIHPTNTSISLNALENLEKSHKFLTIKTSMKDNNLTNTTQNKNSLKSENEKEITEKKENCTEQKLNKFVDGFSTAKKHKKTTKNETQKIILEKIVENQRWRNNQKVFLLLKASLLLVVGGIVVVLVILCVVVKENEKHDSAVNML